MKRTELISDLKAIQHDLYEASNGFPLKKISKGFPLRKTAKAKSKRGDLYDRGYRVTPPHRCLHRAEAAVSCLLSNLQHGEAVENE